MAFDPHMNMAISTIATAPSPATSGTSLVVAAGEGAWFPNPSPTPFNATVWPANTKPTPANSEIVRVTAISTDTFTITRAQETGAGGPAARSIIVGDQIAATMTAKTLTDVELWAPIEQITSATGAQHNFDLDGPNVDLFCTGAAPSFSGFTVQGAAPYAGCKVRLWCKGTTDKVTNEDTNSTAANRIITPSAAGQIVGAQGCMHLEYDDTSDRWRLGAFGPGAPIAITFDAGHFTGNGSMTWTVASGDVLAAKFVQDGRTLFLTLSVNEASVGGTPSDVLFYAFGTATGFTLSARFSVPAGVKDNAATISNGFAEARTATNNLAFTKSGGGNWTASTNVNGVDAVMRLEIS